MLSAKPFGIDINKTISNAFNKSGYFVNDNFKECVFDMSNGIHKGERVIIFGLRKSTFIDHKDMVKDFYNKMNLKKTKEPKTVKDAIFDLPKILPIKNDGKVSHTTSSFSEHVPDFITQRRKIFKLLAKDIETKI